MQLFIKRNNEIVLCPLLDANKHTHKYICIKYIFVYILFRWIYASETWVLTKAHENKIKTTQAALARRLVGITLWTQHYITYITLI